MTKQYSRAGSAGAVALARRAGAVASARRRVAAGFLVPLMVPVAGLATCLTACSSTTAKSAGTASPAAHQTAMPSSPTTSKPSGTAKPSGSPSVSAAACEHVRALRQDLISVTHVKYNGSTAKVVVADLNGIRKELTALKNEPALASEVGALDGAVTHVTDAIKALSTPPTHAQLKAVSTAFNDMKATAAPLIHKLKAACP